MNEAKAFLESIGMKWNLKKDEKEILENWSERDFEESMYYFFNTCGHLTINNIDKFVENFSSVEDQLKDLPNEIIKEINIFYSVNLSFTYNVGSIWARKVGEKNPRLMKKLIKGYEFKKAFNPEATEIGMIVEIVNIFDAFHKAVADFSFEEYVGMEFIEMFKK